MEGKQARGEDGVHAGKEVHVGHFVLFIQLIHELLAENGHKWGKEAGNTVLGFGNG